MDLVQKLARDGVTEFPQSGSSSGEYTMDGRSCLSACKSGRPGQEDNTIDPHAGLNALESMFKKKKRRNLGELLLEKEDAKIADAQAELDQKNADAEQERQRNAAICQLTFKMLISV